MAIVLAILTFCCCIRPSMSHRLLLPSYGVRDEEEGYAALSLYMTLEAKPVCHIAIFV